jgi:hypothetical protein
MRQVVLAVSFLCLLISASTCSAVTVTISGAARDLNGGAFANLRNGNVQVTVGTNGVGGTQNFPIAANGAFTLTILNVNSADRTATAVFTADGQQTASIIHLSLTDTSGLFVTLPEVKTQCCYYYPRHRLFRRCR